MIDDRLPDDIECGARARPRFSTEIVTTDGGWEVRNSRWAYPLHEFEFNLSPNPRDAEDFLHFRDLFYAAGGSDEAFLFKHWADYQAEGTPIGVGGDGETAFQLSKAYSRGAITRTRKITRPVSGTVAIYLGGVAQPSGWSVDTATGIVTFDAAPGNGVEITADFEFDVPVRFADDEIELVGLTDVLEQPVNITLIEVKE